MDLGSANINERLGSLSKNDGSGIPKKDKDENQFMKPVPGSIEPTFEFSKQGTILVQRCVIVQRDEKGYGLTVSGDNPVFVQSVKEDGAAAKAGVQTGDRIIKVNGSLVTNFNHVQVVELIRSGTHVALTLLGRAPGVKGGGGVPIPHLPPSSSPPGQRGSGIYHGNMNITNKMKPPTERVTAPQPVDAAIQQHYVSTRLNTVKLMLEKERGYLDKLKSDYAKTPIEKIKEEMMRTKNRVKNLEFQLCDPASNHHQMLPHSPPPLRSPVECQHAWGSGRVMSEPPPPPPPPRRHGSIQNQMSLPISSSPPVPPVRNESRLHSSMVAASDTTSAANEQPCHMPPPSPPPPPPPPPPTHYPMSYSMDNIQKMSVAPGVVWNPNNFTHSRQRSSPDAILHQTENLRQQVQGNNNNSNPKLKNSHDLSRSHSEITGNRKYGSNESYAALMAKKRRSAEGSSRASSFGAYDSTSTESPRVTPPGTPPPPYSSFAPEEHTVTNEDTVNQQDEVHGSPNQGQLIVNNNIETDVQMTHNTVSPDNAIKVFGTQLPIMSLDDDDLTSDTETGSSDGHGPFECLAKLLKHQAHLAVFLRYLMQTSEPSSLFFYLISDIYKEGTGKEMKKWAYEIHSTFLLPGAPLKVKNIDDTILRDIGQVLASELDKEETLRKVFWKARKKASEELKDHLKDICQKKTLGCISLYGASDSDLEDAIHDKSKEMKIVDNILLKDLEQWMVLQEPVSDRASAAASALATLLIKVFGIKNQSALSIIERVPTFVSKDKSRMKFLKGNKKAITLIGHHFVPQHYFNITYCNHCQLTIWGVGNQGYQCQTCELNIHKQCINVLEETCMLASRASKKDKKRVSGIMENFMGKNRKPSNLSSSAIEKARRLQEEGGDVTNPGSAFYLGSGDASTETSGERMPHHRVEKLRKRFESSSTKLTENEEVNTQGPHEDHHGNGDVNSTEANGAHDSSKKGTSITRSESLRTRREQRPSFRKRSDPNIPRSNSDVDVDDRPVSGLNQSGSSSSSSLSNNIDSPSNSLEAVHRSNEVSPLTGGAPTIGQSSPCQEDSDLEAEADPPNWQTFVDREIVRHMKPKERKRQDVINELFHTERTHVRNLKVLQRVFYNHMKQNGILQPDQIKLLFANLDDMLEIHGRLNSMMKAKRKENQIVEEVGEMMLHLFDGIHGENFRAAASTFCRNQSVALESLKNWQKKDQKLAQFLVDATAFPICRRLQLKDIIPTAMQRLTKYPLLLENLAKYTTASTTEHTNLMRALDCSKDILNAVNQSVKEAEDMHRLQELQRKIDRGPFDKVDNPMTHEFKNLDVTKYKLCHEGQLIWRVNRQKTVDLHALVLSDFVVLLQKQDEKYVLKYHNTNITSGKEETKLIYSPIIKMANLLLRNVATDKNAFFLVSYSQSGPQIYELIALSQSDRKTWIRHITEAADAYKGRQEGKHGNSKGPDVPQLLPEPEEPGDDSSVEATLKNRDSLDNSESQETGDAGETSDTGEQSDAREPLDTAGSSMGSTLSPEAKHIDVESVGAVSPTASIASGSSYSGSSHGPSVSPAGQRRFQRVEVLQIAVGLPLIEPSEVVVSESAILQTAEPVLTPIERLRRKDQAISKALEEKQQLVADILHIPRVDFEHVSDIASDSSGEKDAKELVLAAIVQATHLAGVINSHLSVTEIDTVNATTDVVAGSSSETSPKPPRKDQRTPGVPVDVLVQISSALHVQLTQLLSVVTDREEERERMRQELRASREQIHLLHESRRRTPVPHSPSNSISHSRPNSFISVGSSTSELGEINEHIPPESDEGIQTRLALHSMPADAASPLIEAINHDVRANQYECEDASIDLFVDASESSTDPVEEDSEISNMPEAVASGKVYDAPVLNIAEDETNVQIETENPEIAQVDAPSASSGDVH